MGGITTRVLKRYILFQLVGLLLLILCLTLAQWLVGIPLWLFWGLIALSVIKDIVMFPFVWHAYDPERASHMNSMVGMRGITQEKLNPSGYIRVNGEWWKATVYGDQPHLNKSQWVKVRAISGLTLLVQQDGEERVSGSLQ